METDRNLERKIQDALKSSPVLKARIIKASVLDDVITLTGTVDNYIEKKMVECVTKKMAGIRIIVNRVKVTFSNYSNDNELKGKALVILAKLKNSSLHDASVFVKQGWITIKGETDDDGLKSMLREKMFGIGASGVINLIRILEK